MILPISQNYFQMCMILPNIVKKVVNAGEGVTIPKDTVYDELQKIARNAGGNADDVSMAIAIYLLGFSTYARFTNNGMAIDVDVDTARINQIYEYAKGILKL